MCLNWVINYKNLNRRSWKAYSLYEWSLICNSFSQTLKFNKKELGSSNFTAILCILILKCFVCGSCVVVEWTMCYVDCSRHLILNRGTASLVQTDQLTLLNSACVVRKYNMTILLLSCLREHCSEVKRHLSRDCPVAFICLKIVPKSFKHIRQYDSLVIKI